MEFSMIYFVTFKEPKKLTDISVNIIFVMYYVFDCNISLKNKFKKKKKNES